MRLVMVVVLLLALASSAAFSQNLLTNPGFEDFPSYTSLANSELVLHDWRFFSVHGANASLRAVSPGRTGRIALLLTRRSPEGDAGIDRWLTQTKVKPGERYQATVWAKSSDNASMNFSVGAHKADGSFIRTITGNHFSVGNGYKQYRLDFRTPADAEYVSFSVRVSGKGSLVLDDCAIENISMKIPDAPGITYPFNEQVDNFTPTIAFSGDAHNAYQVIITNGKDVVWDSGEVESREFTCTCPTTLEPGKTYQSKARLRSKMGWGEFSNAVAFTTPLAPVLKITSPMNADSLRGPSATIEWTADWPGGLESQEIVIDGKSHELSADARSFEVDGLTAGVHSIKLTAKAGGKTVSDDSQFYVRITPAEAGKLYVYDLTIVHTLTQGLENRKAHFDTVNAVASLQGLVNREEPRLFINILDQDAKWLERFREPGSWLANKEIVELPKGIVNLPKLFETFADAFDGAVIWDFDVLATSNVAATVAGAENLIPIMYDETPGSLYQLLIASGQIPVKIDLRGKFTGEGTIWQTNVPSTGSKKNDAYIWAIENYLKTGKCNTGLIMYTVDAYWVYHTFGLGHQLPNLDYIVQNKGFVFDLCLWADDLPIDDPDQKLGTDYNTLISIMYECANRTNGMVHMVGFVPWPIKYTNFEGHGHNAGGKHQTVESEWHMAKIISDYNCYKDADTYGPADVANCSVYYHFPYPDRITQNRLLSETELRKMGYFHPKNGVAPLNFLNFYVGDYDAGSWMVQEVSKLWEDGNRGKPPLSWAFNPNHIKRIPAVYEYYMRTATDMDSFIAGDCGAGYVNPTRLLPPRESGLPSARQIWIDHNLYYYRKTNIKITGFIINGTNGPITEDADQMYAEFSPEGSYTSQFWYPQGPHLVGTMPGLIIQRDISWTVEPALDEILPYSTMNTTNFLSFRVILRPPTYFKELYEKIVAKDDASWTLIDTRTHAALSKKHLGQTPDYRATYTFDDIPKQMQAGSTSAAHIGVRNDGWISWSRSGKEQTALLLEWKRDGKVVKTECLELKSDVASSEGAVFDFVLQSPNEPGSYELTYEMVKGNIRFSDKGDYNWLKRVEVMR